MQKRMLVIFMALAVMLLSGGCKETVEEKSRRKDLPVIAVGGDMYEPFFNVDKQGNYTGIDVELAKEAFQRMGYRPVFRKIVWENRDSYLDSGEVDCIWSGCVYTDREEMYDWAGPYMTSYQAVVVRGDSGITSMSELEGKRIAVQASSKHEDLFLNRMDERIPKAGELYCFSTMEEIYACLKKGYCDAIVGNKNMMDVFLSSMQGEVYYLEDDLYEMEMGVIFEKGENREIAKELDETLLQMQQDGTIDEILERYGMNADRTWSDKE